MIVAAASAYVKKQDELAKTILPSERTARVVTRFAFAMATFLDRLKHHNYRECYTTS